VYKKMEPFTLTISDRKVKVKEHEICPSDCDITPLGYDDDTDDCRECEHYPFDTEEESELYRNELLRRKSKAIAIVVESLQDMFKKEIGLQEVVKKRKGK